MHFLRLRIALQDLKIKSRIAKSDDQNYEHQGKKF